MISTKKLLLGVAWGVGFWTLFFYLVLHLWLGVSLEGLYRPYLALMIFLLLIDAGAIAASKVRDYDRRLRYQFFLVLGTEAYFVVATYLLWLRGWELGGSPVVAVACFLFGLLVMTFSTWLAYRIALRHKWWSGTANSKGELP